MGLICKISLNEIKRNVRGLIRELHKQINTFNSAGQAARHIEISSSASSGVRKRIMKTQLQQAHGTIAKASNKVQRIKEDLAEIIDELNRRIKQWDDALWQLKNDSEKIREVKFVVKSYEESQRVAREGKQKLREVIDIIKATMVDAQQRMSGGSGLSGKRFTIDDIVAGTKTDSKYRSRSNYVSLPVTYATVPSLDAERYGKTDYLLATEYIRPNLASPGNQRLGSLSDKIRLGGDYTQKGNYSSYNIKLPNYLNQILRGGYSSKYGVYSTPV